MEQALTQDTNLISSCYTILSAVTKTYGNVTSQKKFHLKGPYTIFRITFTRTHFHPLKSIFKSLKIHVFSLTTKEK